MQTQKSPHGNAGNLAEFNLNPKQFERSSQGLDKEIIRLRSQGQWPGILTQCGMDSAFLTNKHGPCPFCGGKDRFRFDDKEGNGTFICNQCGAGDGLALVAKLKGLDPKSDFPKILGIVAEILRIEPVLQPGIKSFHVTQSVQQTTHTTGLDHPGEKSSQDKAKEAAEKAKRIWSSSSSFLAANDNPYLMRKKIPTTKTVKEIALVDLVNMLGYSPKGKNDQLLQGERILIIPIVVNSKLSSLEFIDGEGHKSALAGGVKADGFWATQRLPNLPWCIVPIGEGENISVDLIEHSILVGEGVATVMSGTSAVDMSFGVAAMANTNLLSVAKIMRERYPTANIIVLADLVKATGEPDPYAVKAAQAVGGLLAVPDFGPDRPEDVSDFNDLGTIKGPEEVKRQIAETRKVEPSGQNPAGPDVEQTRHDWPDIVIEPHNDPSDPFPVDALPSVLREAALEVARFTKTDPASPAVVGLSVAATAIEKKARVEERPGLWHHPSLFIVNIANSGERKSPVFKNMTTPLEQWADSQEETHARAFAKAQAENAIIDGLLVSMKRQALKANEGQREILIRRMTEEISKRKAIPASPRMFTSDVTEEKLFQKLHAHDGSFSVMSGESRQIFDAILGKYSGGQRTGDNIYLAGISGDMITRDRVGNEKSGPEDL